MASLFHNPDPSEEQSKTKSRRYVPATWEGCPHTCICATHVYADTNQTLSAFSGISSVSRTHGFLAIHCPSLSPAFALNRNTNMLATQRWRHARAETGLPGATPPPLPPGTSPLPCRGPGTPPASRSRALRTATGRTPGPRAPPPCRGGPTPVPRTASRGGPMRRPGVGTQGHTQVPGLQAVGRLRGTLREMWKPQNTTAGNTS